MILIVFKKNIKLPLKEQFEEYLDYIKNQSESVIGNILKKYKENDNIHLSSEFNEILYWNIMILETNWNQ